MRHHRLNVGVLGFSCGLGLIACGKGEGSDDPPLGATAAALIRDSTHSGGDTSFTWLPPIVRGRPPRGRLDPTLNPIVAVDELNAQGGVVRRVATFSRATGHGAQRLRIVGQAYTLKWQTRSARLDPNATYRVRVLNGSIELGVADLDVVAKPRDAKSVDRTSYVPLVKDQTLTLRFRIEKPGVPPVGTDTDGDGVRDDADNCSTVANATQLDTDDDEIGDACECLDVVCGTLDSCHVAGVCDARNGACVDAPLPDGSVCDDGSECTQGESCQSGSCTPPGRLSSCPSGEYCSEGRCVTACPGLSTLRETERYPVTWQPTAIAASDLNADGRPDLVVASVYNQTLNVLLNGGNRQFAPAMFYSTGGADGSYPMSIAAQDLNGDGAPDLAIANPGTDSLAVVFNRGDGTFGPPTDYDAGRWNGYSSSPTRVVATDVNGDGSPDLVAANAGSASVIVLSNDGSGAFGPATNFETGGASGTYADLAAGDWNADGHVDLALLNPQDSYLRVLVNDGVGNFQIAGAYPTGGRYPYAMATADLNGDGSLDLAIANQVESTLGVFYNDGFGSFSGAALMTMDLVQPWYLAAMDVNADGLTDLVTANSRTNDVSVLQNQGAGIFGALNALAAGGGPHAMVPVDIDGDHRLELALVNDGDATVSVLSNYCVY